LWRAWDAKPAKVRAALACHSLVGDADWS